ncbi:unnamed protein product [Rhizophagus irregularis]|nr:unnamed protein product [Rhizophagus irregularis]
MTDKFLPQLSQNLLDILEDDEYYDITIEVGSDPYVKIFRAHMVILNYRSAYLRRMLSTNKKHLDGTLVHLKLPNILPEAFHVILRYIYGVLPKELKKELVNYFWDRNIESKSRVNKEVKPANQSESQTNKESQSESQEIQSVSQTNKESQLESQANQSESQTNKESQSESQANQSESQTNKESQSESQINQSEPQKNKESTPESQANQSEPQINKGSQLEYQANKEPQSELQTNGETSSRENKEIK